MLTGWVQAAAKSKDIVAVLLDQPWPTKLSIGSHGYVQIWVPSERRVALLHRHLLGLGVGDKRIGDHINRNPLDCRLENLRIVTASESSANVSGWAAHAEGEIRGAYLQPNGRWAAKGKRGGEQVWLGTFATYAEAAEASDAWRRVNLPGYVATETFLGGHDA